MSSMHEIPQTPDVLGQLLEPVGRFMSMDFARELVALKATPEVQARIDELAERCNEGLSTDMEREEYQSYVHTIHLIGILQTKARRIIKNGENG